MLLSQPQQKGFSSYQLKVLAVLTMTLDHIHWYLADPLSIPFWFSLLGRLAAPLFLFCVVKGVHYTHDRVAYARRLYVAAVLMGFGNWILNHFWGIPRGIEIDNHIFSTLFYVVYFLTILETLRSTKEDRGRPLTPVTLLILPFLFAAAQAYLPESWPKMLVGILLPSPFAVEGSILWVLMGIGLYYSMAKRSSLAIFYLLVSLLFFVTEAAFGFTWHNLFVVNHQWFMIAALPFMLLYNEQRGRSSKWFFYLYYPLHVYVLAAIAWALQ